jgi:hypothetical protein
MISFSAQAIVFMAAAQPAMAYLYSLGECKTFAALFDNTCGGAIDAAAWASTAGTEITCTGPNACVGTDTFDDGSAYECTH